MATVVVWLVQRLDYDDYPQSLEAICSTEEKAKVLCERLRAENGGLGWLYGVSQMTSELITASRSNRLRVHGIQAYSAKELSDAINTFIEGKSILDIQYSTVHQAEEYNPVHSALIIYEVGA